MSTSSQSAHRLDAGALHTALAVRRAELGVSWRQIARECGLTASTLSRLRTGGTPDADGLVSILSWLGRPAFDFTRSRQPEPAGPEVVGQEEGEAPPPELVEQVVQAARTVRLRLGPNAAALTARGATIPLNFNESHALATAVLAVVWPLLRAARAETDQLRVFVERGWDTHMSFGVLQEDGTTTMLPCADWCWACRMDAAQATITAVEQLADRWAASDQYRAAAVVLRAVLPPAPGDPQPGGEQ